jgi:hypothetical protein
MRRRSKMMSGHCATFALLFVGRVGAEGRTAETTESCAETQALNLIVEAHPPLRLGASFLHVPGRHVRFEESLTTGFASFPHLELRGALDWDKIDPLRLWVAYRVRRVDLADLPPIEQHLVAGIGVTSDVWRRISLYANIGVAFQLPPLVDDAAYDLGTYAIENVALVTAFGLRVRAW